MLTVSLYPEEVLREEDEIWDFESQLQEISQAMQEESILFAANENDIQSTNDNASSKVGTNTSIKDDFTSNGKETTTEIIGGRRKRATNDALFAKYNNTTSLESKALADDDATD